MKSLASAITEILKGTPEIFASSRSPVWPTFSSGCDFMMGLGKPQLRASIDVATFKRCRNIKE